MKTEAEKDVAAVDFLERDAIVQKLGEIEREVWESLLEGVESRKQIEIESILKTSIPGRIPPISVLWNSLRKLEDKESAKPDDAIENQDPLFELRSGRLVIVGSYPRLKFQDKLVVLGQISVDQSESSPEIRSTFQNLFAAQLESGNKYQRQRKQLEDTVLSAKDIEKRLAEIKVTNNKELEERMDNAIEKLPIDVIRQMKFSEVITVYQRYGLETAFLSKRNQDHFEYPLNGDDQKIICKNANRAMRLLEDRVFEIVRDTFQEPLRDHFDPNDKRIQWINQKYQTAVPPIELVVTWSEPDRGNR